MGRAAPSEQDTPDRFTRRRFLAWGLGATAGVVGAYDSVNVVDQIIFAGGDAATLLIQKGGLFHGDFSYYIAGYVVEFALNTELLAAERDTIEEIATVTGKWRRKIEHGGRDGQPITISVAEVLRNRRARRLAAAEATAPVGPPEEPARQELVVAPAP